jgi:hypothetical protein
MVQFDDLAADEQPKPRSPNGTGCAVVYAVEFFE